MTPPLPSFKTIALIVAAGRGHRMGGALPKQYLPLKGGTVLGHAISAFLDHPGIDAVRVVIGPEDEGLYAQATRHFHSSRLLAPVQGGAERCASVRLGLESLEGLSPRHVLIHDGARPFVSQEVITRVMEALEKHKGVIPAVAVVDTVKRACGDKIEATLDRRNLHCAQTPQGFDYPTLLSAHRALQNGEGLTDDASLLESLHLPVHLVLGDPENRKITTPADLPKIFQGECMTLPDVRPDIRPDIRVGHGIDVHAIGAGDSVTLLGVLIPAGFSLVGHSDADVGLHSLTDALLGAIGDGDIGEHFSPREERWKGADSSVFLKDAARRVREKGGKITHVDVTIMGERPKISPYRTQMVARVAELLALEPMRVSVKATTTEKLGFVGREEGLAAFATATVVF